MKYKKPREPKEFDEKVVKISRVSKKTKGGNKISFSALVVVGNRKGRVGVALGKANDVVSAIKKGIKKAKKKLITVPLVGTTIPHQITIKNGAAKLILKPAPEGTGVIAGGSVRSVLELAGVRNVVAKTLGTNNKLSNVTTTFIALRKIKQIMSMKKKLGQIPKSLKLVAPDKSSNEQQLKKAKTTNSKKTVKPKTSTKPKVKKTIAKKPVTKSKKSSPESKKKANK